MLHFKKPMLYRAHFLKRKNHVVSKAFLSLRCMHVHTQPEAHYVVLFESVQNVDTYS